MAKRKRSDSVSSSAASTTPEPCEVHPMVAKRDSKQETSSSGLDLSAHPSHEDPAKPLKAAAQSSLHEAAPLPLRWFTVPTKPAQPFRLLDLPPELRNNVYQHFFDGSTTEMVYARRRSPREYWVFDHKQRRPGAGQRGLPALLAACKQIRAEATSIFVETTQWTADVEFADIVMAERLLKYHPSRPKKLCLRASVDHDLDEIEFESAIASVERFAADSIRSFQEQKTLKSAPVELVGIGGKVLWHKDVVPDEGCRRFFSPSP